MRGTVAVGEVGDFSDEELARWRDETPSGHKKAWDYQTAGVLGTKAAI